MDPIMMGLTLVAAVAFCGFVLFVVLARKRKDQQDHEHWEQVRVAAKKRLDHILNEGE